MPSLSKGDIIKVQIKTKRRSNAIGDLDYWDNVDYFEAENVGKGVPPGEEIFFRVTSINSETAFGIKEVFKISHHLKPEDYLKFTLQNMGANEASHLPTNVKEIRVPEGQPGETVGVKIKKLCKNTAYAKIEERIEKLNVGDDIEAEVRYGSTVARDRNRKIDIQLDEPAKITSSATIKLEQLESMLKGYINSYQKKVPEKGEILTAEVQKSVESQIVVVEDLECEIQIEEESRATGKVDIKITSPGQPLNGEIESYRDLLPERGDIVEISANQGMQQATHRYHDYTVQLEDKSLTDGFARAEIKSVDEGIVGKIESYGDYFPELGDTVTATVSLGESSAKPKKGNYVIHLDGEALSSGRVDVKITGTSNQVEGYIKSYRGRLPEEGDRIKTMVESKEEDVIAEPYSGNYRIEVVGRKSYTGTAIIEIIEIDSSIKGEIVEKRENEQQKRDSVNQPSPFGNKKGYNNLLNGKKL